MKLTPLFTLTLLVTAATVCSSNAAERPQAGPRGMAGLQQLQQSLRELNLTEDQQTKLREFMQENMEALRSLREDASLSTEDKLAKLREFQTAFQAKAKEVLTKEQYAQLEKSRASAASSGSTSENAVKRPESTDATASTSEPSTGSNAENIRERMQQGMAELNLSDEQQEKVRSVTQEQMEAMKNLRNDSALSREEKVAKFQETQDKLTAKMKEILNAEQFAKWEKQRDNFAESLRRRAKQ